MKPTITCGLKAREPGKRPTQARIALFYQNLFIQYMTLSLGWFSLTNLFYWHQISLLRPVASFFSIAVLLLFGLRAVAFPKTFQSEIHKPGGLAAYQTGIMSTYFLAQTLHIDMPVFSVVLWAVALFLNFLLLGQFIKVQLQVCFSFTQLTPVWYLMFIGVCSSAMTGYQMQVGLLAEWIAGYSIIAYIVLTPFMFIRILDNDRFDDDVQPTKAIMCAAPSLCLATLLTIYPEMHIFPSTVLFTFSQFFLFWMYTNAGYFMRSPFFVTFSSFTFPLGISCTALFMYRAAYVPVGSLVYHIIGWVGFVELIIATVVITAVILMFWYHTFLNWQATR